MDINKYIKGLFEKNVYKYYTITIPEDYYQISINLYSLYGKACIKMTKEGDCLWEINPNDSFGRVKIYSSDVKIGKASLKDVNFLIGITNKNDTPEGDINDISYYYLEIQGLYNNEKQYYHLISERSIICDTGNDNYCHVLINKNHYYNINYNLIYASLLESKTEEGINIYANFYTENDFFKKTFFDSIQNLFPNKTDYSQNSNGKNYLLFDSKKMNDKIDNYILLTIDCGKKNNSIKLILSGSDVSKTLLPYNTQKLIWLYRDINFFLPYDYNNKNNNNEKYLINIKALDGSNELVINNGDSFTEIKGNYYLEAKSYI